MGVPARRPPWVIVAGGFHESGGMDRANRALAAYLLRLGTPVHLVGHEIDPALLRHPLVSAHEIRRPRGMPAIAERLLGRAGRRVARDVTARCPDARVLVNGGNCPWRDINWVHAVHAAWPARDHGAPWWSRLRNRRLKAIARRRERDAIVRARVVIVNSGATGAALREHLGIPAERIRTVYLGSDASSGAVGEAERRAARARFRLRQDAPVVAFVGALGVDVNKGFDVLWDSWKRLSTERGWDAQLLVAGAGWRLSRWRSEAAQAGSSQSVRFLGFTPDVPQVLAAADLLVSPVRYEAYGLNVQEALCRGLAVMVSRAAGVTERFDAGMAEALLPGDVSPADLAERLRVWRTDADGWRARAAPTAARLRARGWDDMAAELVEAATGEARRIPA